MKKRFYDQDANVSSAVEMFLLFPDVLQEIIADGFGRIAERECQVNEALKNIRSLGTDRVLALYKSKQKKRKYDQNPTVHKAMNYLLVLSPEKRLFISQKIMELMTSIQDYLKTCKVYSETPDVSTVQSITDVYVQMGPEETKKFLAVVKDDFKARLEGRPLEAMSLEAMQEKASILSEAIHDQGLGMRIKGDIRHK